MAIVGAVGTGKTSACMYPYVEQPLAYRPNDQVRKVGGLVLEVKGDFCGTYNDLDAYALAYGIATLMTNLFGRGKEPFWQQASTNLVKFVILLHQR